MKIFVRIVFAVILLSAGFAAGFPVGQGMGFSSGSEWALVQADILAREAGVFMPVYLAEGTFRVVVKQPRHLYKRARLLAEASPVVQDGVAQAERSLIQRVDLSQRPYPLQ